MRHGRALTIAQREGDTALEIRTLIYTGPLVRRLYRHQVGLEMLLQAIVLARRINDPHQFPSVRQVTGMNIESLYANDSDLQFPA